MAAPQGDPEEEQVKARRQTGPRFAAGALAERKAISLRPRGSLYRIEAF